MERVFPGIETRTAIQAVCAWPNLQITPAGELLACIFNQPCHGKWEGDLDCCDLQATFRVNPQNATFRVNPKNRIPLKNPSTG